MARTPRTSAPASNENSEGNAPEVENVPGETKADKFVRLSQARASNVLYHLRNLGKLGGPGYEWTPEQKARLFAALRKGVDEAEANFKPKGEKGDKPSFTY